MTPAEGLKNAYEQVCDLENLHHAFIKARRGKTLKPYVIEFEKKLAENLQKIRNELLLQTYRPKPLETFIIRDPKTRKISKSAFPDRVVHHAICNIIEPLFDKRFIHDSFANRIGKGTIHAIERFDHFKRKVSHNNTIKCFVLKADIRHYFDTVNHRILLKLLSKHVNDERLLWLIKLILNNHQNENPGKGMPLGNLTSQFFANVYLNELDQYVKHKLREPHYIRYVDDFVILHQSTKKLAEYKQKIDAFLKEHLDIELHPDKSQILKLEKGIGFLGFRIFYHHKILRKKNVRKFQRKMEALQAPYREGIIEREKVIEKFEGWLAYANNGNTYKYRKRLTSTFNQAFPAKQLIQITSVKKHEKFNNKIDSSKIQFTYHKTLHFIKRGMSIKQIAEHRGIKEATVWAHLAQLIEYHQIPLKSIIPKQKVAQILEKIKSPNDTLKEIKARLTPEITYDQINCVLANLRGKNKKKSTNYFINWYKRTNCFRKCYYNKKQRLACKEKFQILNTQLQDKKFTKQEFLDFFNNHTNICVLPEKQKLAIVTWKEFKQTLRKKYH